VNNRRIILIVAVVLAVGTGVLTLRYLTSLNQTAPVAKTVDTRAVVVANRLIPAHAKIRPDMLTTIRKPIDQVEPGSLSDAKQAAGTVALISIPANTPLTETKVGHPAETGLTARLRPGMRAVTIPVDAVKAVSDLIEPGDRVDVLASVPRGPNRPPHTYSIIRGALVLATAQKLDNVAGASPDPNAKGPDFDQVTLGVSPYQAELLTMADINTTLRLALRSADEPVRSLPSQDIEFPENIPAPAKSVPAPFVPAPMPIAKAPGGVTIIDGDKVIAGIK
jgi:pilus assembly protein CpaB